MIKLLEVMGPNSTSLLYESQKGSVNTDGIDWTSILGIIALLVIIGIRAGIGIKDLVSSTKNYVHDDVKVPVNNLTDKVDALSKRLHEFIIREEEDHKNVIDIMKASGKSHREMLSLMKKIDHDHQTICDHEKLIQYHDRKLARHDNDIKFIKKNVKKNRGKTSK